jgi:SAM-dependent methyltransferase
MPNIVPDHYDPVSYWKQREHPNTGTAPGISLPHRNYFSSNTVDATSVLELGPGIGRLFPLYKGMERVAALDLSRKYKDHAKNAAHNTGVSLEQHFLEGAVEGYPFKDQEFDVAVASFVLLHVPFENIRHTLTELSRVSKKVIVFDGDDPNWPATEAERKPSSHCFRHNHGNLCEELGLNKTPTERFQGGSIGFCFSRYVL